MVLCLVQKHLVYQMMICDYQIYPGVIVNVKIIGVLLTEDEKGSDEKVLVVPSITVDPNYNEINHYTDLPKYTMSKIKHFFEHYKDTDEHKWVKVKNFADRNKAVELLKEAGIRYSKE